MWWRFLVEIVNGQKLFLQKGSTNLDSRFFKSALIRISHLFKEFFILGGFSLILFSHIFPFFLLLIDDQ